MNDRDELADLIEDTIGTGYTGRVVEAAADAILARWRLVPVDEKWVRPPCLICGKPSMLGGFCEAHA